MNDLGWFVLIAVAGISLASMAVRGIARQERRVVAVYVAALALAALAGALIALAVASDHLALGVVLGIAAVEVGPALGRGVGAAVRALVGRIRDAKGGPESDE